MAIVRHPVSGLGRPSMGATKPHLYVRNQLWRCLGYPANWATKLFTGIGASPADAYQKWAGKQ